MYSPVWLTSSCLLALSILLPASAQTSSPVPIAVIEGEDQLPDGAGALLRREFPGWKITWVAAVDFRRTRYSVLYGTKDPLSAMILLGTTGPGSRIIKADTSLFPMNEELRATPPLDARVAIAQALVQKNAARYGNVQAYLEALKNCDMVRDLAPEQRTAIENLGGVLPQKRR